MRFYIKPTIEIVRTLAAPLLAGSDSGIKFEDGDGNSEGTDLIGGGNAKGPALAPRHTVWDD